MTAYFYVITMGLSYDGDLPRVRIVARSPEGRNADNTGVLKTTLLRLLYAVYNRDPSTPHIHNIRRHAAQRNLETALSYGFL